MLASLQSAVRKCLERKQRLGQYAVVWEDGRAQRLELNANELQGPAPPKPKPCFHKENRAYRFMSLTSQL